MAAEKGVLERTGIAAASVPLAPIKRSWAVRRLSPAACEMTSAPTAPTIERIGRRLPGGGVPCGGAAGA